MAVQVESNKLNTQLADADRKPQGPQAPSALPALLVQITAVLCLGLFLEVVAAMRPLLTVGGNPWAWLPVVFLPLALTLALLTEVMPSPVVVRAFGAAMGLAGLIGVLGTVFHLAAHGLLGPRWGRWLQFGSWLGDPPVFAPMSFALLALVGAGAIASPRLLGNRPGRSLWHALGVPRPWRPFAALGGCMTLVGIALVASPARAVGMLVILAGALWQGALILGTIRTHRFPTRSIRRSRPVSEGHTTPAD